MIRIQSHCHHRGSTLIIVVVFLVLLTILVLGFLSRALLDLQISDTSANRSKGDDFARGALDCVMGDLKQEIVDGSTSTNSLYLPNYSTNMVPAFSGINPVISNGVETDGLNNVLKVSLNNAPFYKGASINRASNIATTTASLDNRSISLANWNRPLLMPATSTTDLTPTASGFPTPTWIYVARDGSNPGGATNAASFGTTGTTANNSSPANSSYVIGRYSYVIYNEGGLLDANVAGSPDVSSMNTAQNRIWSRKGPSVFTDLTQLPGLATLSTSRSKQIVDTLIGWRSQASAQPAGNFPAYSFIGAPLNNFLNFQISQKTNWMTTGNSSLCNGQSDRMFTSRQQLISFFQGVASSATELTALQKTLQYISAYSRCLNQPSYWPPANRPMVVGPSSSTASGNPSPGSYTGGNSAYGLDNVYNPIFRAVRVTSSFVRSDGSIAKVGDPLVEKRFALSRLCWLTYKGPSATLLSSTPNDPLIQQYLNPNNLSPAPSAGPDGVTKQLLSEGTVANIKNYFGLTWTPGPGTGGIGGYWTYAHGITSGTATVIGTLSDPSSPSTPQDVLSAKREPDFFELLKAGICVGAIAKTKTNGVFGTTYSAITESTVSFQILQLGANIITQANPSQYPIWIKYNYGDANGYIRNFYGSTDLPGYYSTIKMSYLVTPASVSPGPWPPTNISSPPSSTGQTISNAGQIFALIIPSIWNPYDVNGPGGTTLAVPSSLAPSQLRIAVVPAALTDPTNVPAGTTAPSTNSQWAIWPRCVNNAGTLQSQQTLIASKWYTEDATAMTFSNVNTLYRQPTVLFQQNIPTGSNLQLGPSNALLSMPGATSAGYAEQGSGTSFFGFPLGIFNQAWTSGSNLYCADIILVSHPSRGSTIRLEFNAGTATTPQWIPYQEVFLNFDNDQISVPIVEDGSATNPTMLSPANAGLFVGGTGAGTSSSCGAAYGGPGYVWGGYLDGNWGNYAFDPRSTRWGNGIIIPGPKFSNQAQASVVSNRISGTSYTSLEPHLFGSCNSGEGWTNSPQVFWATNMGGPSQNLNTTTETHYADPDGTIRRAMGGLVNTANPTSTIALPMATNSATGAAPVASGAPIILHRPFHSVTELGYVFSDTPWRNIDFFTPESGYAPLLDIFCIDEDYRSDALVAGRVDLNTRQEPVIQALLSGAYRDESAVAAGTTDTPLSSSEATTVANLLLARTSPYNSTLGKGPLINISDLVGRYVSGSNSSISNGFLTQATYDGFSADLLGKYTGGTSSANNLIQRFMEAAPRALSDSGQVGTWNLLIDIVAQTGRCSGNATSLSNFLVQGERHYWVHVAIDRQTGKVIDENIEPVNL